MKICIEAQLLNHPRRSGLMTYTEGLVYGMRDADSQNHYDLVYYSLRRPASDMPGPGGENFTKRVLKIPDRLFWGRQRIMDSCALPAFLSLIHI